LSEVIEHIRSRLNEHFNELTDALDRAGLEYQVLANKRSFAAVEFSGEETSIQVRITEPTWRDAHFPYRLFYVRRVDGVIVSVREFARLMSPQHVCRVVTLELDRTAAGGNAHRHIITKV